MKSIYFDTNVFTHIHHLNGVTACDVIRLRDPVAQDRIRILLSTQIIEETICGLRNEPEGATARLELIFDLTSWTALLKFHADLLIDEIKCYAFNRPMPSPFYPENLGLKAYLLDSSPENRADLLQVASETQEYLEWYKTDLRSAMDEHILPIARQIACNGERQSFDDYWDALAIKWVEGLANDLGLLDKCRARGLSGLLAVKCVHVVVSGQLSLTYAQTYEGRRPQRGDSRDMQHALLASVADVFVTDDAKLLRVLSRRPIPDLEVMNLRSFMATLAR